MTERVARGTGRKPSNRQPKQFYRLVLDQPTDAQLDAIFTAWPTPTARLAGIVKAAQQTLAAAQAAQETRDDRLQPDH